MIYLDYASTTPLDQRVRQAMMPFLLEEFGNPSSLSSVGKRAKEAMTQARNTVAKILNCRAEEIVFTSGGTESNNLAIQGVAWGQRKLGKNHIITTNAEHSSVLETCRHMEEKGFRVTYLPVDQTGRITAQQVEAAITSETVLITVMYVNNELGTVSPIKEIAQVAGKYRVAFHTDACQASLFDLDVQKLGVTLLSLNGSKIYGPKGVGVLYRKYGMHLQPVLFGGGQEFGLRPGTENVAGIVGFAKALEIVQSERDGESRRLEVLRERLKSELVAKVPDVRVNEHPERHSPCTLNVSIAGVESEAVLLSLDEQGVVISSGSACQSNALEASHVLVAIGLPGELAHGTLRFSLGRWTTEADVQKVVSVLPGIVSSLRLMSPAYQRK